MNKRIFLSFAVVLLLIAFYSCDKANQSTTFSQSRQVGNSKVAVSQPPDSPHTTRDFFYAHWDKWGRAKYGCAKGWGLCNFSFCFFVTLHQLRKLQITLPLYQLIQRRIKDS